VIENVDGDEIEVLRIGRERVVERAVAADDGLVGGSREPADQGLSRNFLTSEGSFSL
jgi:hypothetical protein